MLDSHAYAETRESLNTLIRYTHRVNLWTVAINGLSLRRSPEIHKITLDERDSSLEELDDDMRQRVKGINELASLVVAVYLVESSLILLPLSILTGMVTVWKKGSSSIQGMRQDITKKLVGPLWDAEEIGALAKVST